MSPIKQSSDLIPMTKVFHAIVKKISSDGVIWGLYLLVLRVLQRGRFIIYSWVLRAVGTNVGPACQYNSKSMGSSMWWTEKRCPPLAIKANRGAIKNSLLGLGYIREIMNACPMLMQGIIQAFISSVGVVHLKKATGE